jgi:hypothetical protein
LGAKTRLLGLLLMVVVSTAYPLDSFRHLLFADYPATLSTVSLARCPGRARLHRLA